MTAAEAATLPQMGDYDVIIIGGGIIGAMIARQLAKLQGRFAVVEKEAFPGCGVSKASLSQIHLPDFCPPGSLKGRLCRDAPASFKKLAVELDVLYREVDELWLATEPSQVGHLKAVKGRAESHGTTGFEIIGPQRIRELEPHVTPNAVAGLYAKGLGVIYTPEWNFALIENAVQNGVQLYLQTKLVDIGKGQNGTYRLITDQGTLTSRYVINAAGLFADEVARMAGDRHIRLSMRKGTMLIFDRSASHLARHMIFGSFSETHSQDIAPTAHGNLILGVHYVKTDDKSDTQVDREGIQETLRMGRQLIPALAEKDVITSFAGILANSNMTRDGDFFISPSEHAPGVVHVMVGAPGLSAAPAIADYVIQLLGDSGWQTEEKSDFNPQRPGWPRFESAPMTTKRQMIDADPKYGHVLCRCEHVTEAEVLHSIRRGARTMDAVKHLTRAGMGRCQGGFCAPFVLKHLADELGIPPTRVTKNGPGSHQIVKMTKTVMDN
ncbi:MAG: FAD-dependent oxidoreductase [Deltaproteobacteria bacterium]|nr:FAD-dependent oxidoreductase [Deltaproteobacteria bacterium]